jgi:large subunit ribosomal protein L14e
MIFEAGRLCVKLAGRDAGKKCVVVDVVDDNYVVIDGATRRKKVNVKHLEPLSETLDIKDKASHSDVSKAFEGLGVKVWNTKKKETKERPKKLKVKKVKPVKAKKAEKKEVPKEETKLEEAKKVEVVKETPKEEKSSN